LAKSIKTEVLTMDDLWWLPAVIVPVAVAGLVVWCVFALRGYWRGYKNKYLNTMEPFFAALKEAGFSVDTKNGWIHADDTIIDMGGDKRNDSTFSGYFYTRYVGKYVMCVSISNPCSEHNQFELEKVIKILKSCRL